MQIIVKPDAEIDIRQANAWYRGINPEIAQRYLLELDAAMTFLLQFPLASPICLDTCRQYVMKRFPYLIIYECTDDIIFIHAVFHASRDRTAIVERISQ
ncbi:MAG: type II toxin-antitoxin system RelE/ParE family toxin [Turneriella sp.]